MVTTIYIDSLAALNWIVNYLLLMTAAIVTDTRRNRWRISVAALLGAVYAAAVVFPQFVWLSATTGKIVCAACMLFIAFGGIPWRKLLRLSLVFMLISAMLAGCVMAVCLLMNKPAMPGGVIYLPLDVKTLLITTGVSYAIISLVLRRTAKHNSTGTVSVTASWGDKSCSFTALVDSGHSLTDPFSGDMVLIVEWHVIAGILPNEISPYINETSLRDPAALLTQLADSAKRVRLLPYRAVGTDIGFLLGVKPDLVTINNKTKKAILALSPGAVSDGAGHTALISAAY